MRKIVEIEDAGLESLLGETVTFLCVCYFYTGKLVGVNDTCVQLDDAKIVYETGSWGDKKWADAQELPGSCFVQISSIEAFGVWK